VLFILKKRSFLKALGSSAKTGISSLLKKCPPIARGKTHFHVAEGKKEGKKKPAGKKAGGKL